MGYDPYKDVLTTGQVAQICHVAPRTVSKWFDSGKLRGYRIPGSRDRRIPRRDLLDFMRSYGMPTDELDGARRRVLIMGSAAEEAVADLGRDVEIRTTQAGFAAGAAAQQFRPHVIIIAEPSSEEALRLCRQIRQSSDLPAVKLAVISADSGNGQAEVADLWLTRPVSPEALREAVQRVEV